MTSPPAEEPSRGKPAGWYDDPESLAQLRYWDGLTWSVFASRDGVQMAAVPSDDITAPEPARLGGRGVLTMAVTLAVLALVVATALWGAAPQSDQPNFGWSPGDGAVTVSGSVG